MAKKFLVNIDLVQNQILNASFQVLGADPGSPVEGQFWYNSTVDRFRYRANGVTYTPLIAASDIPAGAITIAQLAVDPLARANHTGTQLLATISDVTATAAEVNILDGVTATAAEINILDGLLPTQAELNFVDGVTSNIQTQLNAKQPLDTELTAIAALAVTDGNFIVGNGTTWVVESGATARTSLGLGTAATAASADLLNRANHTGTQTAATISDFNTAVRTNTLNQMAAPTAAVSMNNQLLTNVATPVSGTDAANKNYVDTAVAGLSWKESVVVATTANIALTGTQTIDGVGVLAGERVLVKNQTTGSQNGIYVVAAGAWTRSTDADSEGDLLGAALMVEEGTTQAGTQWILTTDAPITVGTTALSFTQFGAGSSYVAGAGLILTGNSFSVDTGLGLTLSGNDVVIDTTITARHFAASVGNGALTSIPVVHSFGTRDVVVDVYDNATFDTVECDVVRTDANTVTVSFSVAPASNAYRVVVVG